MYNETEILRTWRGIRHVASDTLSKFLMLRKQYITGELWCGRIK